MKFYVKCRNLISHLESKYPNKKIIPPLRVALFSLKEVFNFSLPRLKNNKIQTIAFLFGGGIGDLAISLLYLQQLYKFFSEKMQVDIYCGQNIEIAKTLCPSNIKTLKPNFYPYKYFKRTFKSYDLVIKLDVQFPLIEEEKPKQIEKFNREFKEYLVNVRNFYNKFPQMFDITNVQLQQNLALALNKNRISAIDIDNSLNLNEKTKLKINLSQNIYAVLKKYGLENTKFITINRSVDINNQYSQSIRFWPLHYYNELTEKIKKTYPDIKIVQFGNSSNRSLPIKNIDINLIGKTSFEECLALLCSSILHIDTEGGLVHLRHLICKKTSIVLFGPTSIKFKGYIENINLKSSACKAESCEWLMLKKWQEKCLRGDRIPLCMQELSPQKVFTEIENLL